MGLRAKIAGCVFGGFALLSGHAQASYVNVDQLNHELEQSGATWRARETRVNHLSESEIKGMLGLRQAPAAEVEFAWPGVRASRVPSSLDWRNKDHQNWISPILDQGNCGSCVAFATIATLETQMNISSLLPTLNVKLSPQNLFNCGGGACDMGWEPASAADYLLQSGVVDESCRPYISGATGQDLSCSDRCSDAKSRTYHIRNYSTPTQGSLDLAALRAALQKGPLVTTLTVYADFVTYSSGVYKHQSGDALGGHAVSIVGYDDATQSFVIRNSWGEDWGEKGFAKVAYTDVSGIGNETWQYQVPAAAGAVAVLSPRDQSYVAGAAAIRGLSSYSQTHTLTFTVYDSAGHSKWSQSCTQANCELSLPSDQLPDGRYEIQAVALDAHGAVVDHSDRQYFYVANQTPKLSLSFAPNGFDITQPLTDRVVFSLKPKSSTVPMTGVTFHTRNKKTGKETTRDAHVVVDGLTMGWRTNLVPNGSYEIWFEGHFVTPAQSLNVSTSRVTVTTSN